ncbi:sigma-70 family RNA polymerase sigma factor [Bacillus infantis]|uniref:sigma-70 family RNA polymerase sigma factor n=1 Tax=Bacillus infantis TaxID=324767 RepID=UPI001653EA88|nr:sigma-70 family RNA polymerase sigma factor [Bacillus infantis]
MNPDIIRDWQKLAKDEAIEYAMDLYGEKLKRFIYTYTKSWTQTEDVLQEVFLSVYMNLDNFKGESSFKTWIYRIAANKCKDHLRSWHYLHFQLTDKLFWFDRRERSAEDELVEKAGQDRLMENILKLPVKYRESILLYYVKEFSMPEIAGILDLHIETVKTRIRRGREKLKVFYSEEEGNEFSG